uniref:Butyrophilin subfamily 1 member A1-like isoform X2 n=1 Tax=Geotrypetes seraphini TaxID=260995 RepID=A0A6P8PXL1_GEOSA|nr:butyrophilin subfamily 1 member A1-like isoform X2 [Geotrypetes seraphini]
MPLPNSLRTKFFFILLMFRPLQIINAVERFKVIGPDQPVVAVLGEYAMLSCRLLPPMSTEHMHIRWFRNGFHDVVHLYENQKDQIGQQSPEYQGRTELITNHINGSVSLRINNVGFNDEGTYTCFFQSPENYEEANVELKRASLGSALSISVIDHQDRGIRVLCESSGWYPEPEVIWRQEDGQRPIPASDTETQEHDGLIKVKTSLLMRTNQYGKISCHIRNALLNQEREMAISIADAFYQRVSRWVTSLSILLVSVLIPCGLLVVLVVTYLRKESQEKESLSRELEWRKCRFYAVDLTLDPETAHPNLVLSEDRKSISCGYTRQILPDNPKRFDTDLCVLGCQGFTSGKHYWEVEVGDGRCWILGVCEDSVRRKGGILHSPKGGYWTVQRRHGENSDLTFSDTPLSLSDSPRAVGIFLDYEAGKVSFYNPDNKSHLFNFTATFTGTLRPFFYSYYVPLTICPVAAWE